MTFPELLTGLLMLTGLAMLRFGVPVLITWLVGRLLKRTMPAAS